MAKLSKPRDTSFVGRIAFLVLFLTASSSFAGIMIDIGGIYYSDSLTTPSDRTSTQMFYGGGLLLDLGKQAWLGFNYSGINQTQSTSTTTTFGSSDMGVGFKYQLGRGKLYNFGAAYNLISKATYSSGTTNENWEGTSFLVSFGVSPEVAEKLYIGMSLSYFSASYTKKIVNNVESSASNGKTWLFPMLTITKQW